MKSGDHLTWDKSNENSISHVDQWEYENLGGCHVNSWTVGCTSSSIAFLSLTNNVNVLGECTNQESFSPKRTSEIRSLFDDIDKNGDGRISEDELRLYARETGLPTTYVREFLNQARFGWKSVPFPWLKNFQFSRNLKPLQSSATISQSPIPSFFGLKIEIPVRLASFLAKDNTLDFKLFQSFVAAKDSTLRNSFEEMDSDKDGFLTFSDLQRGIGNVNVLCPKTGKFVPVRSACVPKMMEKIKIDSERSKISFKEFRAFFSLLPRTDLLLDYWLDASCHASCHSSSLPPSSPLSPPLSPSNPPPSPLRHLVAGGLAGALSRSFTAPLETLRIKAMVEGSGDIFSSAKIIAQQRGWRGFFMGNGANVLRAVPQKAIDFFSFETYRSLLSPHMPLAGSSLTAGALAGATSTVLLYPLDLIRGRLTVQSSNQYNGILDTFQKILKKEGFPALYRGLGPSVLSVIPEAAITYGCFDTLKNLYRKISKSEQVGVKPAMACGVISAFSGQLVAFPLDLVARRMQTGKYESVAEVIKSILAEGGVKGFYRGIVPASVKVVPLAIVSFGVYEGVKKGLIWLGEADSRWRLERFQLEEERRERNIFANVNRRLRP